VAGAQAAGAQAAVAHEHVPTHFLHSNLALTAFRTLRTEVRQRFSQQTFSPHLSQAGAQAAGAGTGAAGAQAAGAQAAGAQALTGSQPHLCRHPASAFVASAKTATKAIKQNKTLFIVHSPKKLGSS